MPTPGQFAQTGVPTVMRRAQSTNPVEYGVAFSGTEFQTPSSTRAVFYGVGNVASPTLTKMVTAQTLVTTSVAGSTGPTVAIQDVGNLISINDSDAIASLVILPAATGLSTSPSAAVVRRSLTGNTELLANIGQDVSGTVALRRIDVITAPTAISSGATGGIVGFHCSLADSTGAPAGTGIFRHDPLGILNVKATGDPAPGFSNNTFASVGGITFQSRFQEWNDANNVAFKGQLLSPGLVGIWAESSSGVQLVAAQNTPADPTGTFSKVEFPSINNSGTVVFKGCLESTCFNEGIWLWTPTTGNISIAKQGSDAPDTAGSDSGLDFGSDFGAPVISQNGFVAFTAALTSGAIGLFVVDGTGTMGFRLIAKSGDQLRNSSLVFGTISSDIAIAQNGEVAFISAMTDASMVDQGTGLFMTTELDTIMKIERTTEFVPTNSGTLEIQTINFNRGSPSQGTSGLYGEGDITVIAYQLLFKNSAVTDVVIKVVGP